MAPIEHVAQGLVPGRRRAVSTGQEPEAIIEARGQFGNAQGTGTRGCNFDGQRQSIEPPADFDDEGHVGIPDTCRVIACQHVLDEELDGGLADRLA